MANPSSAKDEMVSSMGESAEFEPGFLASAACRRQARNDKVLWARRYKRQKNGDVKSPLQREGDANERRGRGFLLRFGLLGRQDAGGTKWRRKT